MNCCRHGGLQSSGTPAIIRNIFYWKQEFFFLKHTDYSDFSEIVQSELSGSELLR